MFDFIITLFFGMFGVHKFKEGNTTLGVIYLFTMGLFGIGWLYDVFVSIKNIPKKGTNPKSGLLIWEIFKFMLSASYRDKLSYFGIIHVKDIMTINTFHTWWRDKISFTNPLSETYNATVYYLATGKVPSKSKKNEEEFHRLNDIFIKTGLVIRDDKPPYELVNLFSISKYIIQNLDPDNISTLSDKPDLFLKYESIVDGYEFEKFLAYVLEKNGYTNVQVTQGGGDQGVDIICTKNNTIYAIQCKLYTEKVGNSAVQQIVAGKNHYNAHVAIVATNSSFTKQAIDLANSNNVLLWDGTTIEGLIGNII